MYFVCTNGNITSAPTCWPTKPDLAGLLFAYRPKSQVPEAKGFHILTSDLTVPRLPYSVTSMVNQVS